MAGPPCIIMPLCGPTCKIARFQAGLKFPSWTECGKNQLFPQGQNPKNLQKVHTIIKDKKKTNKANKVYQVFQYNITEGQVEINPRRWNKKRYSASHGSTTNYMDCLTSQLLPYQKIKVKVPEKSPA